MGMASQKDRLENLAKLNKPSGGTGSGSGGGVGGGLYRTNSGTNTVGAVAETVAVDAMLENQQITAETKDVGDLFEYKIKQPVTIHKNQSALVPILQARIDAEKVSLWAPGNQRALRALWLTNSSGLTLDRGSFSIQEGETFAGEGLVDPIKPGEKRLISYAADPSILIDSELKTENERVRRIVIKRGFMTQTEEQRQHKVYTIRNQDKAARTVIIEHPLRKDWELVGVAKPEETTTSHYRFRVIVEPEKTASLAVDEVHSYGSRYEITNLNDEQITLFLQSRKINPEVETALRPIIARKNEVAGYESQIGAERRKLSGIFDDQKRLRDNLAVLKGNAEERTLAQRYTGELNRQEDELASLRNAITDLESKRDTAKAKLDAMLQDLTLDTTP
jgi:hypothetical protein